MRIHVRTLLLATLSTLLASPVLAQDDPSPQAMQRARDHFKQGQEAYKAGNWSEALASFEAGYAAVPRPGFLLNIAQTSRKLGDLKKARAHYKKFLLIDPESKQRSTVEQIIAEIDSAIADEAKGGRAAKVAPPPPSKPEPPREDTAKSLLEELNKEPEKESGGEEAPVAQADPDAAAGGPPGIGSGGPGQPGGADITRRAPAVDEEGEEGGATPVYKKWWFWTAIGVVAAGAAVGVYLGTSGAGAAEFHKSGSLGALRKP